MTHYFTGQVLTAEDFVQYALDHGLTCGTMDDQTLHAQCRRFLAGEMTDEAETGEPENSERYAFLYLSDWRRPKELKVSIKSYTNGREASCLQVDTNQEVDLNARPFLVGQFGDTKFPVGPGERYIIEEHS
jgi:hypothetical protein